MNHLCRALVMLASLSATTLVAQPDPAPAPVPTAITSAKKIFLGNAGETDNQDCRRAYNEFYAGLAGDPRFQVVLDPANADLVLELHYEVRPGEITGPHSNVDTSFARQFRLILIEPHTHTVLWSLTAVQNNAILQSNRDKNLDEAVLQLFAAFKALTSNQSLSPQQAASKSRFSQEGKN